MNFCHTRCAFLDSSDQKNKDAPFFLHFLVGRRRRGGLASGSLEVIPASAYEDHVRLKPFCPACYPSSYPLATYFAISETTVSMRQNREVGICLRHSCWLGRADDRERVLAGGRAPGSRSLSSGAGKCGSTVSRLKGRHEIVEPSFARNLEIAADLCATTALIIRS